MVKNDQRVSVFFFKSHDAGDWISAQQKNKKKFKEVTT